jgi:hypothetical protein
MQKLLVELLANRSRTVEPKCTVTVVACACACAGVCVWRVQGVCACVWGMPCTTDAKMENLHVMPLARKTVPPNRPHTTLS